MDFRDKRILVTGSTTGIGRAAAQLFLESGARVAVNGPTPEEVNQTIGQLQLPGAVGVPGSVRTVAQCDAVVHEAVDRLRGMDVLVNAVEACSESGFPNVTDDEWDMAFDINARSALFCTKFAVEALERSRGVVIMLGAIAGLFGGPSRAMLYSIAKAGVMHMVKELAIELAPRGVRVNAVCPGLIEEGPLYGANPAVPTEAASSLKGTIPLGRLGTPREAAASILFLASDLASYCTGTVLIADGGCAAHARWGRERTSR